MSAGDRKSRAGWWIAAGVGVTVALVYLFDPKKGPDRRRRLTRQIDDLTRDLRGQLTDALDAGLRQALSPGDVERVTRSWTPGTRLVAGAVGGSLALYGYRSVRRYRHSGELWAAAQQMQRQVANTVGLQASGR